MEYFIVDEGLMWGKVLEILARKAKEGVDVRVMYDGSCEFALLPRDYPRRLKALGIKCKVFAPVSPFVSTHYNYRDHRKILVIDGHTAFNGGVNLADEYMNEKKKFGYWKDVAVMVKGEAVKSFTLMFLQMWGITEKEDETVRFLSYPALPQEAKGFVIPYGDCPLDNDKLGERVYMDILNRAVQYVHIMNSLLDSGRGDGNGAEICGGERGGGSAFAAGNTGQSHSLCAGQNPLRLSYCIGCENLRVHPGLCPCQGVCQRCKGGGGGDN